MRRRFKGYRQALSALAVGVAVLSPAPPVFAAAAVSPARDDGVDLRRGFANVARKAIPAVVFIRVEKTVDVPRVGTPFGPFFFGPNDDLSGDELFERFFGGRFRQRLPRGRQPFVQMGQGSGFIITKDGYILTNTHVVGDADKIRVKLNNGKEYTARRVGADTKTEIAVIKIEADNLPTVELGEASKLEIGEWVVAIGNPFGLSETLTAGVVSAKGRSNIGIADYEDFIQTDAAINPGNSGGPLLNVEGRVVGINTAIFSQSGGYMGIGFAVPIDMAVAIKDQLIRDGRVTRGYLGVSLNPGDLDEDAARSLGLKEAGGVLIAGVQPKGPAERAGLRDGDVILELNGEKVRDSKSFRSAIAALKPGTQIDLAVARDGERKTFKPRIDVFPDEGTRPGGPAAGGPDPSARLGLSVRNLTPEIAAENGYPAQEKGVVIADVAPGSAADREGLKPGMLVLRVNRTDVTDVEDFQAAVRKAGDERVVSMRVKTPEGAMFVFLRPEK
jgi:serine protease Do